MDITCKPVLKLAASIFPPLLLLFSAHAQTLRISEIVADNAGTLTDSDGDSPDWIELHNPGENPVNLGGWYLTDDPANLAKWPLPATNIAAKGFIVIFASDKNRAVPGAELHTNFKLSAAGEYIALVRPDGATVENGYPFPALPKNTPYGYAFSSGSSATVILDQGAPCKARIPTGATDAAGWKDSAFNDAGWLSGTNGVGYDTDPQNTTAQKDYRPLTGLDVAAMKGVNQTVYIRVPFTLPVGTVSGLTLKMKYDDAFAAYINGTQAAASPNAPSPLAWNSGTATIHEDAQAVVFEEYDLTGSISALNAGNNLLAIHGLNKGVTSSDLLFLPRLEATFAGEISAGSPGLLTAPTPGSANSGTAYLGFTETPVTFPARGFYDSPVTVSVSNLTPGATIRYTLDSSEPTESSPLYTGPLTISSTVNLRVRAFLAGWKPSFPRTDTYIFADDVILQPEWTERIKSDNSTSAEGQLMIYGMNPGVVADTHRDASNRLFTVQDALKAIPTLSITTDRANLFDPHTGIYVNAATQRWERAASAELINPDGSEGFHINAGLRIRGGYSRHDGYPKHAFRLFFSQEYGESKLRFALFEDEGVKEFDKIDLRTSQNYNWAHENSPLNNFMRDIFSRDTMGAMGQPYTRSRFYHLYLNGQYWGLYMTEERPVASFGESYFGGDKTDYDAIKVIAWDQPNSYTIEATDGTTDAYRRLYDKTMAGFATAADYFAVQGLDANGEPDSTKEKLLDVENMIDYLLYIYFSDASDNGITAFFSNNKVNNIYAVYNRLNPDGFKWFQHDCEHSLDSTPENQRDRTGPFFNSNLSLPQYFNAQMIHQAMMNNAEYKIKFADRVHKHLENDGALVYSNCAARIDFRAAQIDRAIVANAARWGHTGLDRDNWITAVADTKAWIASRKSTLISLLSADGLIPSINPPQLGVKGGLVAAGTAVPLTAAGGTIYYTTDGTDPRAIGGGIAGTLYSSPVPITKPTQLKARCRKSTGEWSALAQDIYWTPEIPLAVTELMYNAPGGNPHEFIEIRNISSEPVPLKGYKLDRAIDFKFELGARKTLEPGQYLVVVDDLDAFSSAYPTNGISVAGEYGGDFSNSGEAVDLEFKNNDLISFTYSDARNWPQAADGAGHSLVPLDSAMDGQERGSLDYGGNWRASTFTNGSPGFTDPTPNLTVLLNEITAHTDTGFAPPFDSNDKIELFNPTASAVTLTGWYLSDDPQNPAKWPIPAGTAVPANGFVLFDEDDFHPGRTNGFGLDKAGEQLLLSAPGRVVDAVRFKGQENGLSWGRYPDGGPNWITTRPTPQAPNQPAAATLRIRELMYNPRQPGNDFEYIRIENAGTGTAAFQNETGTYRLDGDIEFSFPPGTALAPGASLWVLSFNPTNTAKLNLFCTAYGLNAATETFTGGYKGSLPDRAGRVAIEYPQDSDDPLKPLDISWIVVDEVFYFDQSPWPDGADGTGYPLIRTGLSSWIAPSANDTDADQMDDRWELDFFGSLDQPYYSDWDFDGQSNLEEFIAGTNPTNAASRFTVGAISAPSIFWTAEPGRVYSVWWTDNLEKPFTRIAAGLTAGSYTDPDRGNSKQNFYRIEAAIQ